MNKKSLLLAALAAVTLTTVNAFAYGPQTSASPAAAPALRPIPASVVQPSGLPRSSAGAIIDVEFSLDQAGQPRDIKVLRVDDAVLKRQLVAAFSQWRFDASAIPAGIQKRFILPIEIRPEV